MKSTRIIWAAVLAGVTAATLVGYTSAGAALPMERIAAFTDEEAVFAPLEVELPQELPLSEPEQVQAAPLPGLLVAIRSDELPGGTRLSVFDADGVLVNKAGLDAKIGASCELAPGADYTVESMDGLSATFHLEENASITNVQGAGWTDGEVLYLTASPRCTLTVLVSVGDLDPGQTVSYLLTGPDYEQRLGAGSEEGEAQRKLVFSGLEPGDYTLTAPTGQTRDVSLTTQTPAVSISME